MKRIVIAAVFAASAAVADELDAFTLGDIIGSEKACGLTLDQSAIVDWIKTSAPADDAAFADHMNGAAGAIGREIAKFGDIQRAAHCAQTEKVARAFGFVK